MVSLTLLDLNPRGNLYIRVESHFANPNPRYVTGTQQ